MMNVGTYEWFPDRKNNLMKHFYFHECGSPLTQPKLCNCVNSTLLSYNDHVIPYYDTI